MEIDVTKFVTNENPEFFCTSVHESGLENIGQVTWMRAQNATENYNFLNTKEKRQAARDHFLSYGAWDEKEVYLWSNPEINALFLQEISSALRELEGYETYQEMLEAFENGNISGRLYPNDKMTKWFFCLDM